jgi:hypothetical protein
MAASSYALSTHRDGHYQACQPSLQLIYSPGSKLTGSATQQRPILHRGHAQRLPVVRRSKQSSLSRSKHVSAYSSWSTKSRPTHPVHMACIGGLLGCARMFLADSVGSSTSPYETLEVKRTNFVAPARCHIAIDMDPLASSRLSSIRAVAVMVSCSWPKCEVDVKIEWQPQPEP